jgi:hypothetical protein
VVAQEVFVPVFGLRTFADELIAGRTTSALSGQQRESLGLRGDPVVTGKTYS